MMRLALKTVLSLMAGGIVTVAGFMMWDAWSSDDIPEIRFLQVDKPVLNPGDKFRIVATMKTVRAKRFRVCAERAVSLSIWPNSPVDSCERVFSSSDPEAGRRAETERFHQVRLSGGEELRIAVNGRIEMVDGQMFADLGKFGRFVVPRGKITFHGHWHPLKPITGDSLEDFFEPARVEIIASQPGS